MKRGALLLLGLAALASGCPIYVNLGYWEEVSGGASSGSDGSSTKSAASGTTSTASGQGAGGDGGPPDADGSGTGGACGVAQCTTPLPSSDPVWNRVYEDPGVANATGIVVDDDGDVIVVGEMNDSVDFGCGALMGLGSGSGMFVAKLDPCGACLWSENFGVTGPGGVGVAGVAVDASNSILVTGSFTGSFELASTTATSQHGQLFVAKLDQKGVPLWLASDTGSTDTSEGTGVAVDGLENVFVTGVFQGKMDFGGKALTSMADDGDMLVAKLSGGGVVAWAEGFGSTAQPNGQVEGTGIAVDGSGNVLVTGNFNYTIDFVGCGALTSPAGNGATFDPFVAKLDPMTGACAWRNIFPFNDGGTSKGIAVDGTGDVFVTGSFSGPDSIAFGTGTITSTTPFNLFVAKVSASGADAWGKGFGASGSVEGDGIAVDATGRLFVTGPLTGSADFGGGPLVSADSGTDFLLASFDADGSYRWAKVFAGHPCDSESGSIIALDASFHVLLAGWVVQGTTDFGCGPVTIAGGEDAFVAKFMQ